MDNVEINYYSFCVIIRYILLVDHHWCGWISCDVMLCVNNIRNWFIILYTAVNITLTVNVNMTLTTWLILQRLMCEIWSVVFGITRRVPAEREIINVYDVFEII